MPTYKFNLPLSKFSKETFADLGQMPSLDGEGAEGGWSDIEFSE